MLITDQDSIGIKSGLFKEQSDTCPSSLAYRAANINHGTLTPRNDELVYEGGEDDEESLPVRPPTQEVGSSRSRPARASQDVT